MLTFNLKKQWFDKIKNGEKTHEYREIGHYWRTRLKLSLFDAHCLIEGKKLVFNDFYCTFVCGYAKKDDKEKRLKAKIKSIRIINGTNTDLAVDKDVYDIEFELLED